jgi:capsular polysaccharide biosynthesis protein
LRVAHEKKVVADVRSRRIGLSPLEEPVRLDGTVAWLWSYPNYGHWLLLALPLVEHYRSVLGGDPDYYYVGAPVYEYQLESLEMLGISRERVVSHAVTADRVLAAIADRHGDYDTDFLLFAERQLEPDASTAVDPGKRLFVSRAGAGHRRLVNELACARALQDAFGVELVSTDGLSLAEEIALFRGASLVVGAHGAGLTNVAFAPPTARVVELASTTYWDSLFAQIASVKGQTYALVRGRSTRVRLGVPASWHNFEIDIEDLVAVVGEAVATTSS